MKGKYTNVRRYAKQLRTNRAKAPTWHYSLVTNTAKKAALDAEKAADELATSTLRAELAAALAAFEVKDKEVLTMKEERYNTLCYYEQQRGRLECNLSAWKSALFHDRDHYAHLKNECQSLRTIAAEAEEERDQLRASAEAAPAPDGVVGPPGSAAPAVVGLCQSQQLLAGHMAVSAAYDRLAAAMASSS